MGKLNSKIMLKVKHNVFNIVNKNFKTLYKGFEALPNFSSWNKSYFPEIKTMNNIYVKYMKLPSFKLSVSDNLIPVKFKTEDGLIISGMKYITDPDSNKWIIGMHWFAGHKFWTLYSLRMFIELGYNIFVFDFRNHGQSDRSEYVTMGLNESLDFKAAIRWLHENHHPKILGVFGMSMGGFVASYAMCAYAKELKKYNIRFCIVDSFYGSITTLLSHTRNIWLKDIIRHKKIRQLIESVIQTQSEITGLDWKEINVFRFYDGQPADLIVPTLYCHGRNDKVTPFDDSLKMFIKRSIYSRDDEILIYDASPHCLALKTHPQQTIYRWLKFENKIIKDHQATKKAFLKFGIDENDVINDFNEKFEINTLYLNSSTTKRSAVRKKNKSLNQ